jgi:glycosyltransferase involved in cell wall biosynthesis
MFKVAIDSGPLKSGDSVRGIGVYTRELLKALKMDGVDVSKADLSKFDVVHFTRFHPFFVSLPFSKPKNTKFVLTIYDLIPLIYPKHYPPGIKGKIKWQLNKYLIHKNVDAIITISETSKKDICRFLEIDPSKVFVTHLAPRQSFKKISNLKNLSYVKIKYSLPPKFALYVGDVNYNKNILNLIKACDIAKIPLVIIGKQAAQIGKMDLNHRELIHLKGIDWKNVTNLGFVDDNDLVKIYNLATLYVQPSFYEGFGLPLLEAYACGTPIAVSKNQCHVEILGSDFLYFDPNNPSDIAHHLLNPNKHKNLSRNYNWSKTGSETSAILQSL